MVSKIKTNKKPLVDYLIYWAAIIYPLTAVPQIIQIYQTKSAGDLAILSWLLYVFFDAIFLWYAIVHKQVPIIVTCVLWILVYSVVILGIILYG
jgi:uncharacterized protein with PQ loop repeat